jgi:dTDP-glucose pyrophosphorylase/predicted transcriptional regulator
MKDWKKTLISPTTPILEAMRIIDTSALQIALVTDENSKLIGVVTDGDIRRGLLNGVGLEEHVQQIMHREFTTANLKMPKEEIIALMKKKNLLQMPIVDDYGCVVDLKILVDMINFPQPDNWIVLMAGGLGSRLKPLTDDCPKPLLRLGNKPILEIILRYLIESGFKKYFISVNYKAEMIEKYFGDGARWGIEITYLREKRAMGTAGALGLLPDCPTAPLIVMNADLLTKVNIHQLLDFHSAHKATATMCVRDYHFQVPFGVVKIDQHRLISVDEKPIHRFFVNAGIYVLSPSALGYVPRDMSYDMTKLFEDLIAEGHETAVFPLREYWLDIGRLDDYERANHEYYENISNIKDV